MMKFNFSKEIYNIEAVMKAAYSYTDIAYLHIESDDIFFYVSIEPKGNNSIDEKEFQNTVLNQMIRQYVWKETRNVRELVMARAFSSTVITRTDVAVDEVEDVGNIDDILTNWFDKYGQD